MEETEYRKMTPYSRRLRFDLTFYGEISVSKTARELGYLSA